MVDEQADFLPLLPVVWGQIEKIMCVSVLGYVCNAV
jgi:hypothetical protein